MQLISKHNKRIRYLLCAIYLFSKNTCVVPLKNKKSITIVDAFQSILDSSKESQTKYGLSKVVIFITVSFKKWLKDNDMKMYSTCNEGKSVFAEGFIRTLKNKIFKHMTTVSKKCLF